jgi:hypothetical protein
MFEIKEDRQIRKARLWLVLHGINNVPSTMENRTLVCNLCKICNRQNFLVGNKKLTQVFLVETVEEWLNLKKQVCMELGLCGMG